MTATAAGADAVTVDAVLASIEELAPTIAARAAEIEAARRLPADLLDALVDAGCFAVLLPRSHGGMGADLVDALRVYEAIARADASTGWTTMIGGAAWVDLAGLPRATFDDLFGGGRSRTIVAGAFNPTGSITPAGEDAYRVSGRWSFASGCEHADWLFGNCIEGIVDGMPRLRIAVFSPGEVTIEDTWTVSGMRGTGSHHFRADDVTVPADRTFPPLSADHCLDEPAVRVPTPSLIAVAVASVALGAAQGALDEVTAMAQSKMPLFAGATLAANPLFQRDLAAADTDLRAARALLHDTAASAWARAVAGDEPSLVERARTRAAAVWVAHRAAAVVDTAFRAGGGTSIYADCPLQRRLRDVHALTQHFIVRDDTLVTAGAILAGEDVSVMVF